MKNKVLSGLLIAIVLTLAVIPSAHVQAKVQSFSDIYLELSLPDDAIVLTKDSPDTDKGWQTAGIVNVKSEKDSMTKMGVRAIFFDPETKSLVRLLQKQSSQTSKIFNLSLLSDQKKTDFFNSLTDSKEENTKASIEEYPQKEADFFRYNIEITKDNTTMKELIYGTIVNGYTFSFDIYQSNKSTPIDETFVKALVDGTHFTKFLDKAEVEKETKNAAILALAEFAAIIIILVALLVIRKRRIKKQKFQKDVKASALSKFYEAKKAREEQNIKDEVKFINRTKYTDQVIKDFCYYDRFIKHFLTWFVLAVLFLAVLVMVYYSKAGILGCLIAVILMFVFVFYQGVSVEKVIERTIKSYDKNKGLDAVFTFYEDYFTLSGIQYISSFPYLQITDIKQHKDYIYLYLGSDKAFYLKKDSFDKEAAAFLEYLGPIVKAGNIK